MFLWLHVAFGYYELTTQTFTTLHSMAVHSPLPFGFGAGRYVDVDDDDLGDLDLAEMDMEDGYLAGDCPSPSCHSPSVLDRGDCCTPPRPPSPQSPPGAPRRMVTFDLTGDDDDDEMDLDD